MSKSKYQIWSKIFTTFSNHLTAGDTLIVAVSGGPDSTALLDLLASFKEKMPLTIIVAHVNHGIRGRESDRDEKCVRRLAEKYSLRCEVKKVKLSGSAVEERGRAIRREFFEKLLKKHGARFIVTAHTEDDQIETVIFNFFRGSGPAGLRGMKLVAGQYFKPLLGISKKEILSYLKKRRLAFCIDRTNEDTVYTRNFIRKKIMPLALRINPSFRKTLIQNSVVFSEISEWLKLCAQEFLKKERGARGLFPRSAFEKLPPGLKRAVIQESYRQGRGGYYSLPLIKVDEVLRIIDRGIGNKKIICGGGGTFVLSGGWVDFL